MLPRLLIILCCTGLISCDLILSGTNPHDERFRLVAAYGSSNRLNIIHDETFDGEVSFIVSAVDLGITSESGFLASPAYSTRTDLTITADDLLYNDYIDITGLMSGRLYHVYLLDVSNSEVFSMSATTNSSAGYTTVTGTYSGANTYPFNVYLPAGYDQDSPEGYPLLIAIKWWDYVTYDADFPCIVIDTDMGGSSSTMQADMNALKNRLNQVIGDNTYNIDKDRIYAIGYSAGGCAAMIIANDSTQFRVKAVIGLGISWWLGRPEYCGNLGDTGIWLFYGQNDTDYGQNGTRVAYQTIPQSGGDHFLTEIAGTDHGSCQIPLWSSPVPMEWLLGK